MNLDELKGVQRSTLSNQSQTPLESFALSSKTTESTNEKIEGFNALEAEALSIGYEKLFVNKFNEALSSCDFEDLSITVEYLILIDILPSLHKVQEEDSSLKP
ncbi:hypothetical protein [Vibrio crassostreae]|uniref:hypothetical protein n=1 Tax=Vibrio crassostreae TaxID=246167 RepID=UPI001B302751|nr:hypothetical protein [Vibrio crassostreae]